MEKSKLHKIALIFSLFALSGMVMFGHATGNVELQSLGEGIVSMKYITALVFHFCAWKLCIYNKHHSKYVSVLIFITISYAYLSWQLNGVRASFVPFFEVGISVESLKAGVPSLMTMFCFAIWSLIDFLPYRLIATKIKLKLGNWKWEKQTNYINIFIIIQALICLILGHGFDIPIFRYYVEDYSTAEAIITAILFLHIGVYSVEHHKHKTDYEIF